MMKQEIRDRIEKIKNGEVPEGYRKTEIGAVPKDWDIKLLGDVAKKILDGTHTTPKYTSRGVKFYSVENITNNDFKNTRHISYEEHEILSKRCPVEIGDILMTRITAGVLGDTKLIDWDVNASIYVSLALIKPKNKVDSEYIYSYTKSRLFSKEVYSKALINATPMKINLGDISIIKIIMPKDEREKQKIASILSTWDKAIELKEKLIEEKKKQKKGLMQKLLTGEVRLPGFDGEWKEVKLVEVCSINKGSQLNKSNMIEDGKYPALNGGISPSGYTNNWNTEKDTITVSEGGNSCGYVNYMNERFWCGGHCYAIMPDLKVVNNLFMYQILKYNEISIMGLRVGSGLPNIQKKSLEEFCIIIPMLIEQEAIANILFIADNQILLLEQELEVLKLQKKGLMQLLLTGIVRVNIEN